MNFLAYIFYLYLYYSDECNVVSQITKVKLKKPFNFSLFDFQNNFNLLVLLIVTQSQTAFVVTLASKNKMVLGKDKFGAGTSLKCT